jgi:hypothetical protein
VKGRGKVSTAEALAVDTDRYGFANSEGAVGERGWQGLQHGSRLPATLSAAGVVLVICG